MIRNILKQQLRSFARQFRPTDHSKQNITRISDVGPTFYEYYDHLAQQNDTQIQYKKIKHNIMLIGHPTHTYLTNTNTSQQEKQSSQEQDQSDLYFQKVLDIDQLLQDELGPIHLQLYQFEPSQYIYNRRMVDQQLAKQNSQQQSQLDLTDKTVISPANPYELKLDYEFLESQINIASDDGQDLENLIINQGLLQQYKSMNGVLFTQMLESQIYRQQKDMYLIEPPEIFTRMVLSSQLTVNQLRQLLEINLETINELISNDQIGQLDGLMYKLTFSRIGVTYFKAKDVLMIAVLENIIRIFQMEERQRIDHRIIQIQQQNLSKLQFKLKINEMKRDILSKPTNMVLHLKMPHFYSLQALLGMRLEQGLDGQTVDPLDWNDVFNVDPNSFNETDEQMIEKQVLLDILFESDIWGQKYSKDYFVYLQDKERSQSEKDELNRIFQQFQQQYRDMVMQKIK